MERGDIVASCTDKFLVYIEEIDVLKELSDEEMGKFFRALVEFVRTGKEPEFEEKTLYAFRYVTAHILRDQKKYREVVEKRSMAGKKSQELRRMKRLCEENSEEYLSDEGNGAELKEISLENADLTEQGKSFGESQKGVEEEKSVPESNYNKKENAGSDNQLVEKDNIPRNDRSESSVGSLHEIGSELQGGSLHEIGSELQGGSLHEIGPELQGGSLHEIGPELQGGSLSKGAIKEEKDKQSKENENTEGELKKTEPPIYTTAYFRKKFEEFWEYYPKKRNKKTALKEYLALRPTEEEHEKIIKALKKHKKTDEWIREGGRFVPHPENWIACRRWEDVVEIEKNKSHGISLEDSFSVDDFVNAAVKKSEKDFLKSTKSLL